MRPNGILIVFSGRCKHYAQNALTLFSAHQLLFDSGSNEERHAILDQGIASSGEVELPFEVRLHRKVKTTPGDLYQRRPGFEHEEGYTLSTSMTYGNNKVECIFEVAVYKKVDSSPDEVITLTPNAQRQLLSPSMPSSSILSIPTSASEAII
ncbi:hypothetical protein E8E11_008045 [Didymella keratinophila]|nr:hypothetical protein E8E11_008045 [Didymella keratinophila]